MKVITHATVTLDRDGVAHMETRRELAPSENEGDAEIDSLIMEKPHIAESAPLSDGVMRAHLKDAVADDPDLLRCFTPERARELGLDQQSGPKKPKKPD